MSNTEKKLDALIEALGFDIETSVDRQEKEITEEEGHRLIKIEQKLSGITKHRLISISGRYKRGEDCSYFKELASPEVTFSLKKRV